MLIVERWILACLRHRVFFSLGELNTAIRDLLERLNARAFKKLQGCRRSRFDELDRPALRALSPRPYEFAEWRQAKVHPDYHIEVGRAYYSVPYRLTGQRVDVRITGRRGEVFHASVLVAAHARARSAAPVRNAGQSCIGRTSSKASSVFSSAPPQSVRPRRK